MTVVAMAAAAAAIAVLVVTRTCGAGGGGGGGYSRERDTHPTVAAIGHEGQRLPYFALRDVTVRACVCYVRRDKPVPPPLPVDPT